MRGGVGRLLLVLLSGVAANALSLQATAMQRAFVASTGLDTNPCTLAAPCRTFATALTQTDAGGAIVVLDSAGYGPVAIAQSVSIVAALGVYAGISVFPVLNGVDVDGPGITVTLKGLSIEGQGGIVGINFLQGARLVIEGCTVSRMAGPGISATAWAAHLTIADSVVRRNGSHGISIAGNLSASIVRSRFELNQINGINIADGVSVSVADSTTIDNVFHGVEVLNTIPVTTSRLTVDRLESRGNITGVLVNSAPASSRAIVHVTRSNLSQNITGMEVCCVGAQGRATASLSDSLVAANDVRGVMLGGSDAGWMLTVAGTRIVDTNGIAIENTGSFGTLYTRSDNTLSGNATNTSGTLTPLPGV